MLHCAFNLNFLITNDVEHLSCAYFPKVYILWGNVCSNILLNFNKYFVINEFLNVQDLYTENKTTFVRFILFHIGFVSDIVTISVFLMFKKLSRDKKDTKTQIYLLEIYTTMFVVKNTLGGINEIKHCKEMNSAW